MATYKDLDLDFLMHPITKDVSKKLDEEAIKRSIRNLVRTNFYERLFQPELGSSVTGLLFENFTPLLVPQLRKEITNVIENYETRADLIDVFIQPSNENTELDITIKFNIINRPDPVVLNFILQRTR